MRFGAKAVAGLRLPAGKNDHLEWDDELAGFGVRLRSSGRKAWIVQYRPSNSRRTRRVTLGAVEKLTPVEARAAARKLLARVAIGYDPQGEREAERARSVRTFRSAIEVYLAAKQGELRPASYRLRKLYLLGGPYFRPLHPIGVGDITHSDVAARPSPAATAPKPRLRPAKRSRPHSVGSWRRGGRRRIP